MTEVSRAFEGRSTFIDALRGVAAFSVACYHITRYGPLPGPARELIPGVLQGWFDHGWMGVQVFFVISGFVIAYSVRNARVTPGYLANYALRRSIRLDPPYWTTIAFVLLLHAILHLHLGFDSPLDVPSKMEPALSWKLLLSHLFYVQNIVAYIQGLCGYPQFENLSAGFWTLCIEVQFYLVYVAGQGLAQRFPHQARRTPADASPFGLLTVFAPLAAASLFVWNAKFAPGDDLWWNLFVSGPGGDMWITRFFCMFFLGAAAWWSLDGRIPATIFWIYVAAFAGRIIWQGQTHGWDDDLTVGLCAALAAGVSIYFVGRRGRLATSLNFGILQYLGRTSYSLYLIHFPMSHVVTTLGTQLSGTSPSPAVATLWLVLALAASLAAAHVLYIFIEAPSVRLAARFKRPSTSGLQPDSAAALK
jgi:peptidoglycan/LPS O-acetylase OafA/YrhL